MEKHIALELHGRHPSEVKILNLSNVKSININGLTDEYKNLEILDLTNAGLTSLGRFPSLPKLWKLDISHNSISDGLNFLQGCENLTHLILIGNEFRHLDALKPLQELQTLKNLDLFCNDVTLIDDYREKVFAMLPSLNYLDGLDKENQEAECSDLDDCQINGESLDVNLSPLMIEDESLRNRPPESSPSLVVSLYTVFGLLFHMSYVMKKSDNEEEAANDYYDGFDISSEEEDVDEFGSSDESEDERKARRG